MSRPVVTTITPIVWGWPVILREFPLDDMEKKLVKGFVSKEELAIRLQFWEVGEPSSVVLSVVKEDIATEEPKFKSLFCFNLPEEEDDLVVKLANLSDTHGIVSITTGSIWLAPSRGSTNLDVDVVGKIQERVAMASQEEMERRRCRFTSGLVSMRQVGRSSISTKLMLNSAYGAIRAKRGSSKP